jgi:hypothetical protein
MGFMKAALGVRLTATFLAGAAFAVAVTFFAGAFFAAVAIVFPLKI